MNASRLTTTLFAAALLAATLAEATSYVPMSDAALYEQAPAIAQVSILSAGPAPAVGAPSIDYIVLVERLLKGQIAGSTVIVRVAGGIGPDGWGLELFGAPRFAQGDRAILFLVPRNDGTYGILHLMLGAFHEFRIGDRHLALRDLQDVQDVTGDGRVARPRDFERFADWLAGGAEATAHYRVETPARGLERWQRAFSVLRHERRQLRWFEDQVEWHLGRPAPTGMKRSLKEALRAWNPISSLRLAYGGRSGASNGLHTFDHLNVLTFGDRDDLIPGSFDCRRGGVLAVGGPWFDPEITGKTRPGGQSPPAIRILGADIVLNDGAECVVEEAEGVVVESLVHELGHTLGLGPVCGDAFSGRCRNGAEASVMRGYLHADGHRRQPGERERLRLSLDD